jgi:hypothetical protein
VGVEEVRWEKGGTEWTEDYTFFYKEGNEDHQLGTDFFIHKRNISAVRRLEFINGRMCCITGRGRCCKVTALAVHVPFVDKSNNTKDSFYEGVWRVSDHFPRYT